MRPTIFIQDENLISFNFSTLIQKLLYKFEDKSTKRWVGLYMIWMNVSTLFGEGTFVGQKMHAIQCHLKTCIYSFFTSIEIVSVCQRTLAVKLRPHFKIIQFVVHCLGLNLFNFLILWYLHQCSLAVLKAISLKS